MAITISGVKLSRVSVVEENGSIKANGSYSLMSSSGVALATQTFNEYAGKDIAFSPDTLAVGRKFLESMSSDINKILGLE